MDATFETRQMRNIDRTLHRDVIGLGDLILWMSQLLCQLTIVREQHQTFAAAVEPTDREESLFIGYQIDNTGTAIWI
jgi:hypothetical protein